MWACNMTTKEKLESKCVSAHVGERQVKKQVKWVGNGCSEGMKRRGATFGKHEL